METLDYFTAIAHLQTVDPVMKEVIERVGPIEPHVKENYFISLVESIISQQLSTRVADVIYTRFEKLFTQQKINAEEMLTIDTEVMRTCGLSYAKITYVKELAKHVTESAIMFEQFDMMTDEEIITELVKVKGIGRWTAEMFLIGTMQRHDVFSYGDLGLRRAIQNLYQLKKEPSEKQAEKITKVWRPYRSLASRYLWKSLAM